MIVTFSIKGHKNLLGTHKTTLEFTKDNDLTKNGDCIIGVSADYNPAEIKKLTEFEFVDITIETNTSDKVTARINKQFSDDHEIVIRLGTHNSERTLGIEATKAAAHIKRSIIKDLQEGKTGKVTLRAF